MGDGNLRFMTHLAEELGMPYYAARHEGGAVAMADGYARVTGRVGVCSVTQGPGVTNTLTALTEARKAGTPMLLLAGDTAARILRHNQDVDQTAIFKSVGVTVARVRSPDTLVIDLSRAFNQALALQQPIAISIPTDMQELACEADALAGGGGASANAEPASARGNSARRRVNRRLEAAGDHRRPRGSSFECQGTARTFGRADRRIAGDHRPGQGLICRKSILRGKLWRICMGAG